MPERDASITDLLLSIRAQPDRQGELSERLYANAYPFLHAMASRMMARERDGHTLQPTALVHEAFVKLVDQDRADFQNRSQFLSIAARIMRRILVDHARARSRTKRGGAWARVTLDDEMPQREIELLDLIALEQVLHRLEALHARMARVVEMKVFGGMSVEEIAHSLEVSPRTVHDDWSFARRWLSREMSAHSS